METNNTHIHNFNDTLVPSTCTQQGYTLHKCNCGYEHKDNFKALAPHTFVEAQRTESTCEENGSRKLVCSNCGTEYIETLPLLGHSWGDWHIKTFATCTQEGTQNCICGRCGKEQEQTIPAKGHKFISKQKSATNKNMLDCFCENCGEMVQVLSPTAKRKKAIIWSAVSLLMILAIVFSSIYFFIPNYHYYTAKNLINEKSYEQAYQHLKSCNGFKDSDELLKNFVIRFKTKINISNKDEDEDTTYKTEYEYNENADVVKEIFYNQNNEQLKKHEITYNKDGKISVETYEGMWWTSPKQEYKYDNNGNLVEILGFDYKGNLEYKNTFEYNENGNKLLENSYESDGKLNSKTEYKYDEKGNVLSEIRYSKIRYNDQLKVKHNYEYKYTKDGFKILGTSYDLYGEIESKSEANYKNDQPIDYIAYQYEYGEIVSITKTTCKYDEFGNLLSEKISLESIKEGSTDEWEYKYSNPVYFYIP